jgi:hypothetical protein
LHTLGNLTLTAYNPDLSNKNVDVKKPVLAESHLELNGYFESVPGWRKDDIERRGLELAAQAVKVWPYFGIESSNEAGPSDVVGTSPSAVWILGQRYDASSWRDVLERTMNAIAELEPEMFERIMNQFPRVVGRDKEAFRAVRELQNGAFVEVHLSANDIGKFCTRAIEAVGLSAEDWRVDRTPPRPAVS